MFEAIYYAGLAIIVVAALVVAFHQAIPGGFISASVWGCVAVAALAGYDQPPTRWSVSLVASLAVASLWALTRWQWSRRRLLRRLREWVRC